LAPGMALVVEACDKAICAEFLSLYASLCAWPESKMAADLLPLL
jgi:hypothetical protein